MHVRLLTLRYQGESHGFDDLPLREFLHAKQLVSFREHFFTVGDLPHLACVLVYDEAPSATQSAGSAPAANGNGRPHQDRLDIDALSPDDRALFEALREWRARRAESQGFSRFMIFTNRQLLAIVARKPTTIGALLQIPGVGKGKGDRYGAAVLAIVANRAASAEAPSGNARPKPPVPATVALTAADVQVTELPFEVRPSKAAT